MTQPSNTPVPGHPALPAPNVLPALASWIIGIAILVSVPGSQEVATWLFVALFGSAAVASAFVGLRARKVIGMEVAMVLVLAALVAHRPVVSNGFETAAVAIGLAVCAFAFALGLAAIRPQALAWTLIARRSAAPLAVALGLAIAVVQTPVWSAPLVSLRWLASVDVRSAGLTAGFGLAFSTLAVGYVVLRLAWHRRRAPTEVTA